MSQNIARDARYTDSKDRMAVLVAWINGGDMGGWTDSDEVAFRAAVVAEAADGFGCSPDDVGHISISRSESYPDQATIKQAIDLADGEDSGEVIVGLVEGFGWRCALDGDSSALAEMDHQFTVTADGRVL